MENLLSQLITFENMSFDKFFNNITIKMDGYYIMTDKEDEKTKEIIAHNLNQCMEKDGLTPLVNEVDDEETRNTVFQGFLRSLCRATAYCTCIGERMDKDFTWPDPLPHSFEIYWKNTKKPSFAFVGDLLYE